MKKKGISLIVLVITIVVIIILTSAIVLNISNNNPISAANKSVFLSNKTTLEQSLSLYTFKQVAEGVSDINKYPILNNLYGSIYRIDFTKIPELAGKYTSTSWAIDTSNGKLIYNGLNGDEKNWMIERYGQESVAAVGYFTFENNKVLNLVNNKEYTSTGGTFLSGKNGNAIKITNGGIKIPNADLNISDLTSNTVTVSFWFKWNGEYNVMPFGFNKYDLWIYSAGNLGFNSCNSDVYGIDTTSNLSTEEFKHFVIEFNKNSYTNNKIYINGNLQNLTQRVTTPNIANIIFGDTFCISGISGSSSYLLNGSQIDDLVIYNRAITPQEVSALYGS